MKLSIFQQSIRKMAPQILRLHAELSRRQDLTSRISGFGARCVHLPADIQDARMERSFRPEGAG